MDIYGRTRDAIGFAFLMVAQAAVANAEVDLNLGLSVTGGPAIARIDGATTTFASGQSSAVIGAEFNEFLQLGLSIGGYTAEPLDGGRSERVSPAGYQESGFQTGMRLGLRLSRVEFYSELGVSDRVFEYNSGDFYDGVDRYGSAVVPYLSGGATFNIINSEGFRLGLTAGLTSLASHAQKNRNLLIDEPVLQQQYGLSLVIIPTRWHPNIYEPRTTIVCFDCGYHLGRVTGELAFNVLPRIGMALTNGIFKALMGLH